MDLWKINVITTSIAFCRLLLLKYKSVEIFRKLGNAYYYNSEMEKAVKCYIELFAMTTDLEPEYYYRYAQSLRSIGKNDKANEMLEKYNLLSKKNTR